MTNDSVHLTNDLRRESSVLSVHRKKPKLVHVTTPSSSKFLNYLERLKSAKIYFRCTETFSRSVASIKSSTESTVIYGVLFGKLKNEQYRRRQGHAYRSCLDMSHATSSWQHQDADLWLAPAAEDPSEQS